MALQRDSMFFKLCEEVWPVEVRPHPKMLAVTCFARHFNVGREAVYSWRKRNRVARWAWPALELYSENRRLRSEVTDLRRELAELREDQPAVRFLASELETLSTHLRAADRLIGQTLERDE